MYSENSVCLFFFSFFYFCDCVQYWIFKPIYFPFLNIPQTNFLFWVRFDSTTNQPTNHHHHHAYKYVWICIIIRNSFFFYSVVALNHYQFCVVCCPPTIPLYLSILSIYMYCVSLFDHFKIAPHICIMYICICICIHKIKTDIIIFKMKSN